MPFEDEPLSRRLRSATAVLHQRVEDGVDLVRRTESLESYVVLLRRLESFYAGFEPVLAAALPAETPKAFSESRLPRLRADLDALHTGWEPVPALVGARFESPAHALGGLYVVEGAALGGQVIARHLASRHGLSPERGAAFFSSGGSPIGARWKAVREVLDASEDAGAVVQGARDTFLLFEKAVVHGEVRVA